jgi:hypothetical protein
MAKTRGREIDVSRLCLAMSRARLALRFWREQRREMVRQYVGNHWSEEGSREKVPVNLLSLYCTVVGRNLIANNPRVMLSTFDRATKPTVKAMEAWCNKEIIRSNLQEGLQRWVMDSLFSVGIMKVALATPAESAAAGWRLGAGQPFAETIDLDDFVFDVHARSFEEVGFIGHRYRVPLEAVRDSPFYNRGRKELSPSQDQPYNPEGDERIHMLGRTFLAGEGEEFEDHVDLWEVYLPRHRLVLTLANDDLSGPQQTAGGRVAVGALREQSWLGPEAGPYHLLKMALVPGNAMPKGPLQDLMDLHEASNRAYRKLIRSADRIKENVAVAGGALEDGTRIMNADDGEIIRVDNPERTKQIVFGGQGAQTVLALATVLKDLFVYMGGNLDMMGGLSPQSKTLGQDQLLAQNASRAVAEMQDRTVTGTAAVLRALCWYWWHDPYLVQRSRHALPGLPEAEIVRQVTPQMRRQGQFEDLDIEVDPYSLAHQTPQARMQALNGVVKEIVLPMMQLLIEQGHGFDINAYLEKISKYMDMPDLAEIVTIAEAPAAATQGGGGAGGAGGGAQKPPMPAQTQREYVRHNMPGSTREGSDRNLVSSLLGQNTGGAQEGRSQP